MELYTARRQTKKHVEAKISVFWEILGWLSLFYYRCYTELDFPADSPSLACMSLSVILPSCIHLLVSWFILSLASQGLLSSISDQQPGWVWRNLLASWRGVHIRGFHCFPVQSPHLSKSPLWLCGFPFFLGPSAFLSCIVHWLWNCLLWTTIYSKLFRKAHGGINKVQAWEHPGLHLCWQKEGLKLWQEWWRW